MSKCCSVRKEMMAATVEGQAPLRQHTNWLLMLLLLAGLSTGKIAAFSLSPAAWSERSYHLPSSSVRLTTGAAARRASSCPTLVFPHAVRSRRHLRVPATVMMMTSGPVDEALEYAGTQILEISRTAPYGAFFAISLVPYLLFLKNIWKKEDNPDLPSEAKWAFASLLVFVLSTIIGGIFCKVVYNDQLANIDYVHGVAESLLGATNLVLALVFNRALLAAKRENGGKRRDKWT